MVKGITRGFIVAAQQIDKKHVLPGTPAHGPRLDLAQADVAQREHAEGLEQRSRNVLHAEGEGGLVRLRLGRIRASRRRRLSPFDVSSFDQEEAGEVLLVVFNSGLQNFSGVDFGGAPAGDTRRIAQASASTCFTLPAVS